MSQLLTSGGQSSGVSASTSVLPMNISVGTAAVCFIVGQFASGQAWKAMG